MTTAGSSSISDVSQKWHASFASGVTAEDILVGAKTRKVTPLVLNVCPDNYRLDMCLFRGILQSRSLAASLLLPNRGIDECVMCCMS